MTLLTFKADKGAISVFYILLQEGVWLKTKTGVSLRHILEGQFGLTSRYIEEKISTILLEGKVVDDIDRAVIKEGSVLALSGAMPGLVGATMRGHGVYAPLRGAITYKGEDNILYEKEGYLQIKLFNKILDELGGEILSKGVALEAARIIGLMQGQPEKIRNYIKEIALDGVKIDIDSLCNYHFNDISELIELKIETI